jgi:hypothetical protein
MFVEFLQSFTSNEAESQRSNKHKMVSGVSIPTSQIKRVCRGNRVLVFGEEEGIHGTGGSRNVCMGLDQLGFNREACQNHLGGRALNGNSGQQKPQ